RTELECKVAWIIDILTKDPEEGAAEGRMSRRIRWKRRGNIKAAFGGRHFGSERIPERRGLRMKRPDRRDWSRKLEIVLRIPRRNCCVIHSYVCNGEEARDVLHSIDID